MLALIGPVRSVLANTTRAAMCHKKRWHQAMLFAITTLAMLLFTAHPAVAQAVTWTQNDIGSTGITGTYTYASGSPPTYTIAGGGTGIGTSVDNLTFVSTPAAGNVEIEGRVKTQQNTNAAAEAGLMMSDNLTDHAAIAAIAVTPSNGVNFHYRTHGGSITTVNVAALTAPIYLRLARSGNSISGFYSSDGIVWTLVGTDTPGSGSVMPNYFLTGMYVSSAVSGTLSSCVFDYLIYMTSVPQQASNLLLWLRSDVGVTYAAGKVSAWADQSGNSNNASQGTGNLQPALTTGAINNSILPAITFNGTSQYMSMGADFANLTTGASIFLVLDPTSSSGTGDPCAFGNAANSDAIFAQTVGQNAKLFTYHGSTSSSVATTNTPLTISSYQLLEMTFLQGSGSGTGTGTIFVNGTQEKQSTTMQNLNNVSRTKNYVGTGIGLTNYFQGSIAELLVFSAPLSASQRASVESYVLSKYAIGNTPTLDAPTFTPLSSVQTPQSTVALAQDQNATVYFTTDGTTPTTSSQWYNAVGIPLPNTLTMQALGVMPFFNNSSVASSTYQVDSTTFPVPRSGLVLWLRADDGVSTSGSNVTQWNDESGTGNNASQATGTKQPTVVSNAINGLPAVSFNGSSDFLQLPTTALSNFSSGASVLLVTKPTAVTAGARFLDFGNGATSDNLYMDEPSNTGAALFTYNGSTGKSVSAGSAITLSQFQLLEAIDNGSGTATIYTNGVQQAQSVTMNTLQNIARTQNYIGQASAGGSYFQGQIAEILVFNRGLTSLEQAQLEGYLLAKYQILNSTSTPTPTISVAGATLTAPTQVAIEDTTGSTIYFTQDGTTPTTSSPVYTAPINVTYSQTLKAMAVLNGVNSSVASATYTLNSTQWPAPSSSDTTTLQLQLQLPNVAIPQDSNQH